MNLLNSFISFPPTGGSGYHALTDAIIAQIEGVQGVTITSTRKGKIDTFIVGCDSAGILSKMLGGHFHFLMWSDFNGNKINWLDPQDTDAAFRATATGSPTSGSTGMVFNGTSNNIDYKIKPAVSLPQNSTTIFSDVIAAAGSSYHYGAYVGNPTFSMVGMGRNGTNTQDFAINGTTSITTTATGRHGASRTSSTVLKAFKNGVQVGATYVFASIARPNYSMYGGGVNNTGGTPFRQSCTKACDAAFPTGFTDSEYATFDGLYAALKSGW